MPFDRLTEVERDLREVDQRLNKVEQRMAAFSVQIKMLLSLAVVNGAGIYYTVAMHH